ncbi:hypothetical protein CN931_07020 [Bacillus sp. AFS054943]|jgi:DHA2 family lincomycin resistance protein-like MFS transporter|uniref:hypothetical protein n=1 Tax=unclassified Bacillus (in: firmicutes) TaxID=185979 RepID=UPI000BFD31E4|nr:MULTISPECIES: hypothetical protein [unclassified Bacillus (in: firmicutes)]PGL86234.1 hypothetical protein CN931_07020 [Bacillus sp. AFS054943]
MNIMTTNTTNSKIDMSNIRHTPSLIALTLSVIFAFLNETLLSNALTVLMMIHFVLCMLAKNNLKIE